MDDLLVYIARELVSNPDEVNVKKTERRKHCCFRAVRCSRRYRKDYRQEW